MLELVRAEFAQLRDAVREDLFWNGLLDVCGLRLHALVADRGELTELVGHAAHLPTHAEATGLAGVFCSERLGGIEQADLPRRLQGVQHFFRTTANHAATSGSTLDTIMAAGVGRRSPGEREDYRRAFDSVAALGEYRSRLMPQSAIAPPCHTAVSFLGYAEIFTFSS